MYETTAQPSTTPARRRQGRGNGRPAAQKAYASENDAANIDFDRNPRTPQKRGVDSPAHQAGHTNSKQRPRNKPRAASKNTPTSPESANPGRHTPPHHSSSVKSATLPAFAGATFHASPAPSALPIPSFLARSSNESPGVKAQEVTQEPSPPTDSDVPTPSRQVSAPIAQSSPLDFMFRAHREERERERRGSPASIGPSAIVSDSPSAQSPFDPAHAQKPSPLSHSVRTKPRHQPAFESAELNGTPGRPMGPAFSTPYHERINAARSNTSRPPASAHLPRQSSAPEATEDPSEALKRYLFSGPPKSSTASLPAPGPHSVPSGFASPRPHAHAHHNNVPTMMKSNTTGSYDGRSTDYSEMEDNLRRILKLDLSAAPATTQRRLFS